MCLFHYPLLLRLYYYIESLTAVKGRVGVLQGLEQCRSSRGVQTSYTEIWGRATVPWGHSQLRAEAFGVLTGNTDSAAGDTPLLHHGVNAHLRNGLMKFAIHAGTELYICTQYWIVTGTRTAVDQ